MTFTVSSAGQVTSDAEPNDGDRRRARLLAEGGNFDSGSEDLFARGIAVARNGGDVRAFLRKEFAKKKPA